MPVLNPVRHTLSNGLRVVVSKDPTVPVAAICLWYRVGSCDEPRGRTGLAHLFEHLMFQGSTHVPAGGHTAAVEDAGGHTNAATGFERTVFHSVVPVGRLELVLWLEADRMGGLLDALTAEGLATQRDVVLNERRERYDNVPYGTGWEQLVAMSFPAGHPFHAMPAGSPEDLRAVTLDDCRAFFGRHYGPDRAVLSVVGDVSPEAVVDLAERHFGHIPPSRTEPSPGALPAAAVTPGEPSDPAEARRHVVEPVPGPAFMAAYQLPAYGEPGCAAADLALTLLGGMSSRGLHDRLVRRDQLAHTARASLMPLRKAPSLGQLNVRALTGAALADVERAVDEEVERLADGGVTEDALRGARAQIRRDWHDRLAHPVGRAEELCAQEAHFGDATRCDRHLEGVLDVGAADVGAAAGDLLAPARRAVLTYEPARATAS
ncbi:pitrilysin family protein [Streptomyces litmocidini]|uniref:M16 family metallopeptidase n=1 Tax=Streptomyces TaxID=1883 RepID=UPI000F469835|nr:pitrilysin family protein [Streptomyces sp. PanSC19]ROQ26173.1 putative Zn-dependent peptidase [Streptomyces sp. PanSC19]